MADLSAFPITRHWPAQHPDRIQYYGFPTPNGVKASIALEELGLPYEAHLVKIGERESHLGEFTAVFPNAKIPAIIDPDGPGGKPLALWESGAILTYLADKTGKLLPADPAARQEALTWLWWQVGGLGPIAGQFGFFTQHGGKDWEDKRPRDHFATEVKRLLRVLDGRLTGREWIAGEYSIADIACIGWVRATKAGDGGLIGFESYAQVQAWLERALARPAVQRGLKVPG